MYSADFPYICGLYLCDCNNNNSNNDDDEDDDDDDDDDNIFFMIVNIFIVIRAIRLFKVSSF